MGNRQPAFPHFFIFPERDISYSQPYAAKENFEEAFPQVLGLSLSFGGWRHQIIFFLYRHFDQFYFEKLVEMAIQKIL